MRITLAIGLDGTRINDFFEGGSLERIWKMSGNDDEVDKVSVCRSIMVRTNSFHLLQLGLTQQKRRLTGFQYSLLYLPSTIKSMIREKSAVPFLAPKIPF